MRGVKKLLPSIALTICFEAYSISQAHRSPNLPLPINTQTLSNSASREPLKLTGAGLAESPEEIHRPAGESISEMKSRRPFSLRSRLIDITCSTVCSRVRARLRVKSFGDSRKLSSFCLRVEIKDENLLKVAAPRTRHKHLLFSNFKKLGSIPSFFFKSHAIFQK